MWSSAPRTFAPTQIDFTFLGVDIRESLVEVSENRLATAARALVHDEVAGPESSTAVAARAIETFEKLTGHMARLVGEGGILAIFKRAIALTARNVPWLATARAHDDLPWAPLRAALERQTTTDAIDGCVALMSALVELLGRFIGDDLVARLMSEVWPDGFRPLSEEGT